MTKDTAFHFRTYDDRVYSEFPENFILQSLPVIGHALKTQVHTGDIPFLQLTTQIGANTSTKETLLKDWLTHASLQSKNPLDIAASYTIRFPNLPTEIEDILHLSLAQHEEYLGKVTVDITQNPLHKYLYNQSLIPLMSLHLPAKEIVINEHTSQAQNWDLQRKQKFESFGYSVRFSEFEELFHFDIDQHEAHTIRKYLAHL